MTDPKNIFSDNEYTILNEIVDNENVTQRELSKKLGISVSTVNTLMNKMIREGLIKMTQVSQKQVLYMLTPVGMMEKAKKTVRYLQVHYRAIYETKEKIKVILEDLAKDHDVIYILKREDEMGEMLNVAIEEFKPNQYHTALKVIDKKSDINSKAYKAPVLLHMSINALEIEAYSKVKGMRIVNIMERL